MSKAQKALDDFSFGNENPVHTDSFLGGYVQAEKDQSDEVKLLKAKLNGETLRIKKIAHSAVVKILEFDNENAKSNFVIDLMKEIDDKLK